MSFFIFLETLSRLNVNKEKIFQVGIQNTTDNLDDYNVQVETHDLDMTR